MSEHCPACHLATAAAAAADSCLRVRVRVRRRRRQQQQKWPAAAPPPPDLNPLTARPPARPPDHPPRLAIIRWADVTKFVVRRNPGEWRFFGRRRKPHDATPLQTATEDLETCGFPLTSEVVESVALLCVIPGWKGDDRLRTHIMVGFCDTVASADQFDVAMVNSHLAMVNNAYHSRNRHAIHSSYWQMDSQRRVTLSSKIHRIMWRR